MSLPNNMKTGFLIGSRENTFPETFLIIYTVLAAILRRCGFKDCVLYSAHNKRSFNQEMFDGGVIFNLYSEYGVGKSLKPLLLELFSTIGLDPDKNRYNIFFKEIVRLTPEIVPIIRKKDTNEEIRMILNYSMIMESAKDDIANERLLRMSDILYDIPSDEGDDRDDNNNNNTKCYCLFCHEFRKYYGPYKGMDVTGMINEALVNITTEIKTKKMTTVC